MTSAGGTCGSAAEFIPRDPGDRQRDPENPLQTPDHRRLEVFGPADVELDPQTPAATACVESRQVFSNLRRLSCSPGGRRSDSASRSEPDMSEASAQNGLAQHHQGIFNSIQKVHGHGQPIQARS
jgi:hypothetical protein